MKKNNNYKNVPRVDQCKEYLKSLHWEYQYKNIFNNYVFYNKKHSTHSTLIFSLRELRDAYKHGF